MTPYLTKTEAEARLRDRYGVTASLFPGDLDVASDELDEAGPFVGRKTAPNQEREWPRTGNLNEGVRGILNPTVIPEAVLDWVALRALQLSTDEEPPVKSEGAGGVSVSYATAKLSQTSKRMEGLLRPYILRTGSRL